MSTWSPADIEEAVIARPKGFIKLRRISFKQFAKMVAEHHEGFYIHCNPRQRAQIRHVSAQMGVSPESLLKDVIFDFYQIKAEE